MKSSDSYLLNISKCCSKSCAHPAFTIVELLVVIVVIGVLAAISIVSYTGITQKAVASALQSDLTNAKTQLNIFQVDNSAYPTTISTDCAASPTSTTAPTNLCLKISSNNTYSNYIPSNSSNPQTFSLTASNPALSYSYIVTNNSKPTSLASAPLNPVADWLALPQGDHYGNFYDLVTKTNATVTRTTPKTIYDPATQRIYDVPANKLGIRPRSDGKSGFEAEVEEARTNVVLNSSFESDSNSDGIANNFGLNGFGGVYSLDTSSVLYGSKSQKITKTLPSSDTINQSLPLAITAGETYTFSIWVKGENVSGAQSSINFGLYVDSTGGTDPAEYGVAVAAPVGTFDWRRISVTKTFIYSHTNQSVYPIFRNKSGTVWWDNLQVEKGSSATSYILTSDGSATRNADVVTVPTVDWVMNKGTWFAVAGQPGSGNPRHIINWLGSGGQIRMYGYYPQLYMNVNGFYNSTLNIPTSGYVTQVGKFTVGSPVYAYSNGTQSVAGTLFDTPSSGMYATAFIGTSGIAGQYNGSIQRIIIYTDAQNESSIVETTNLIKDGP